MGYPASEVMRVLTLEENFARAGRNDPCPCGSGRKFKRCHGQQKGGPEGRDQKRRTHRAKPQA